MKSGLHQWSDVCLVRANGSRDGTGWWVASVRGVRGCHTQGRTVDEARRRIVEALELLVDNGRKATLVDEVRLPSSAARAVRAYATLGKKLNRKIGARPSRLDARWVCYEAGD